MNVSRVTPVGDRVPVVTPGLDRAFDLTLARRCIPAGHAGQPIAGDFYDTCVLDDHRFLIAIGDVAGHGPSAGSRMRQLSAAVRRVARWTSSPTELLTVLDKTYVPGKDDDIATVWVGIYDDRTGVLHYASAGHPPPIMAEIGRAPRLLEVASAPPLGTGVVAQHARGHELQWPAGAVLVGYSDGLVERRGHDLADQIDELRRLVGATHAELGAGATPQLLVQALLEAAVPEPVSPLDDVCILVLRRAVEAVAASSRPDFLPPRRVTPSQRATNARAHEPVNRGRAALARVVLSSSVSAEEDRRLAAEDRRQAALYLSSAYRDATTGALSRQPGREQMQQLLDRARREGSALAFVFLDVDGLKQVNDSQGHASGDALLVAVGRAFRFRLRSYDVVVRYGGDEFVCALPGGTADVARNRVEDARSTLNELVEGATVSAGYAELQATDTLDEVVGRADRDLYRSRGRERAIATGAIRRAPAPQSVTRQPSVACGACGERVALADFVVELSERVTRSAECTDCGATTVIELLQPLRPGAAIPLTDDG
jgi:diguanylate cyclase (GGDEF)-like protein